MIGLCISLATLVLALAAAELALRFIRYPTNLVPTLFTPTVGIVNWPRYSGCQNLEGYACYSINSSGWRDIDHALAKPAGVARIAVIGDSFVEALQVELPQTFWKLLESDLRAQGKPVEVLGFGMSGFDVAQYYDTLRLEASPYKPDVVVLSFFSGNDLRDSVRAINDVPWKPYYTLDAAGALQRDESFKAYVAQQNAGKNQLYRSIRNSSVVLTLADSGIRNWPGTRKRLAQQLAQLRAPTLAPAPAPTPASDTAPQAEPAAGLSGNAIFSPPAPGSPYDTAWRVNEALFLAAKRYASDIGARLVILGVDNPDLVYDQAAQAGLDIYYPEERVAALAQANGIPYLPLAYGMVDLHRSQGVNLHVAGGGHWNARGHQEVERVLARFLAEQGLV